VTPALDMSTSSVWHAQSARLTLLELSITFAAGGSHEDLSSAAQAAFTRLPGEDGPHLWPLELETLPARAESSPVPKLSSSPQSVLVRVTSQPGGALSRGGWELLGEVLEGVGSDWEHHDPGMGSNYAPFIRPHAMFPTRDGEDVCDVSPRFYLDAIVATHPESQTSHCFVRYAEEEAGLGGWIRVREGGTELVGAIHQVSELLQREQLVPEVLLFQLPPQLKPSWRDRGESFLRMEHVKRECRFLLPHVSKSKAAIRVSLEHADLGNSLRSLTRWERSSVSSSSPPAEEDMWGSIEQELYGPRPAPPSTASAISSSEPASSPPPPTPVLAPPPPPLGAPAQPNSLLDEVQQLRSDLKRVSDRLEDLTKRVASSIECRVCMDRVADHVLVPSGQAICLRCGTSFIGKPDPWTTETVSAVMRVYLPILTG
jgi:hypothetical protein